MIQIKEFYLKKALILDLLELRRRLLKSTLLDGLFDRLLVVRLFMFYVIL